VSCFLTSPRATSVIVQPTRRLTRAAGWGCEIQDLFWQHRDGRRLWSRVVPQKMMPWVSVHSSKQPGKKENCAQCMFHQKNKNCFSHKPGQSLNTTL
jgi:hypothetical protein